MHVVGWAVAAGAQTCNVNLQQSCRQTTVGNMSRVGVGHVWGVWPGRRCGRAK
jgi:hypothetical protein